MCAAWGAIMTMMSLVIVSIISARLISQSALLTETIIFEALHTQYKMFNLIH